MVRTAGKVSWGSDELKPTGGREEGKKIPFLQMSGNDKSWKVRVVSEDPIRYYCHFTQNSKGGTVKVNCTLDDQCPVSIEKTKTVCGGTQADARFYLKVIDRTDGTIKVLDVGKQIINGIGELIQNPEYGHCKNYDITINKGAKGSMPLYTVTAARQNTPITPEEQILIDNSGNSEHEDFIDLDQRAKPLGADAILKILGIEKSATASKSKPASNDNEEFDDIEWGDE